MSPERAIINMDHPCQNLATYQCAKHKKASPKKVQVSVCPLGAPPTKQVTEATTPTQLHNTSKHQEYLPVKLKSQSPAASLQHTHPRAASTGKDTSKMDTLCSSMISWYTSWRHPETNTHESPSSTACAQTAATRLFQRKKKPSRTTVRKAFLAGQTS